MHVQRYRDPAEFSRRVASTLGAFEAENNLVIGVIDGVIDGDYADSGVFLGTASPSPSPSSSNISAVIVRTPPFPALVAYTSMAGDDSVAQCVTRALYDAFGPDIGGFNSDTRVIEPYIRHWCNLAGATSYVFQRTRIYQAAQVISPRQTRGSSRRARSGDRDTILGFLREFFREAHPRQFDEERCRALADHYLTDDADRGGALLWLEGGKPVSMAGYLGPTPHGIRVNAVYTAPDHRNQGFASACVATLTRQLLDSGRQYCFLFTDLANPTSN